MTSSGRPRGKGTIGKYCGGGCALLILAAVVWVETSVAPPVVRIPTPILPTPNAFDTYVSASSQLLEGMKIDNAGYTPQAARDAGVPYLSLAAGQKLMKENQPALLTLRTGLDQQYLSPPARSFNARFAYYAKFRGLARFLTMDSNVYADEADYVNSARCSLDAIQMGVQIPHGSPLLGGLTGIACQAMGRRRLWTNLERLNYRNAVHAAQRLESIEKHRVSFADTLREDKWCVQAVLLESFRNRTTVQEITSLAGPGQTASYIPTQLPSNLFYLAYSKQRIMYDYTKMADAAIDQARKPYAAADKSPPVPNVPVCQVLAPAFTDAKIRWLDNDAQNGMIEIALAIQAYKSSHGHCPESLSQLSPDTLKALPTDPFASGQPFRYRRTGSSYILYSVGPDGVDDGGKVIDAGPHVSGGPNQRFRVEHDSKGDIVADRNRW